LIRFSHDCPGGCSAVSAIEIAAAKLPAARMLPSFGMPPCFVNKVRILAFRTFPYPNEAPATQRFRSFCRYLAEDGNEVTLLALEGPAGNGIASNGPTAARPFRTILIPGADGLGP
jgi:hypothetical protein